MQRCALEAEYRGRYTSVVDGLELAAVDGDHSLCEWFQLPAGSSTCEAAIGKQSGLGEESHGHYGTRLKMTGSMQVLHNCHAIAHRDV